MNLEWTKYFIKQRSNHRKCKFDYIKLKSSHYQKIQRKAYSEEIQAGGAGGCVAHSPRERTSEAHLHVEQFSQKVTQQTVLTHTQRNNNNCHRPCR